MKLETDADKIAKLFNSIDKLKNIAIYSQKKLEGGTNYHIYDLSFVTLKISYGNVTKIIEFDDTHRVIVDHDGGPQFRGPNSDQWDIETTDMFYNFIDNIIPSLDTIDNIFIF